MYTRSTAQIGGESALQIRTMGYSLTQARPIDLPNPNSGIDALRLRDGRVVLVYNHTNIGRTPLNIAVSRDGEHFKMFQVLEHEPGEYSYPALIQGVDGTLHITYTWNRKKIRYVHMPLSDVPNYN